MLTCLSQSAFHGWWLVRQVGLEAWRCSLTLHAVVHTRKKFGFMWDCRNKLSVRMACEISRHQIWSGKSLWLLESPAMKCSLKFLIARSAEFLLWMWGRNSWNYLLTSLIKIIRTFGHSLSRIWRCGLKHMLVNKLWSFWYAAVRSRPDLVLRGSAWIVFEL